MKRILCILLSVLMISTTTFAQNKQNKTKSVPVQQPNKPVDATPAPAPKMKKNGTPDMRYKANKEAAKPAQKLKKDGTPDMRYKANKEAAKKKG